MLPGAGDVFLRRESVMITENQSSIRFPMASKASCEHSEINSEY